MKKHSLYLFLFFLLISSCVSKGNEDKNDGGTPPAGAAVFNIEGTTSQKGVAEISFSLADKTTKFSVTARLTSNDLIRFDSIKNGSGTDFLSPSRNDISLGSIDSPYINTASIPSRAVDPKLSDSERFTVSAVASNKTNETPLVGKTITFTINSKVDTDLNRGALRVNLFYVGDVGKQQLTQNIVSSAITEFENIYAAQTNISVNIFEFNIDGDILLPSPPTGDKFYSKQSGAVQNPAVNVFIGGDIKEFEGNVLGVSASIPGPPHSSEKSAVAISFFTGAGPDGIYSQDEVRVLGETLAHEVGHYMGLFHPIDFTGSSVSASDPLSDTASCNFITQCISDDSLIHNLMYPSPVSNGNGGTVQQNELTADQGGVMNRYIVTD